MRRLSQSVRYGRRCTKVRWVSDLVKTGPLESPWHSLTNASDTVFSSSSGSVSKTARGGQWHTSRHFCRSPSLRRPYDQDGTFPVRLFGTDHRHRPVGDHFAGL